MRIDRLGVLAHVIPFLLTVVAVAGCGGGPAPAEPITLVFKHARILGQGNPIPKLIEEFEARHPGVRVKAESLPWNSDEQRQFFVINLESGRPGFDVMMLDVIWVPEFARAGWLLDLTSRLEPGELGPFFPSAAEAAVHAGRTWALPWNMNVGLLYYRKDLLARHGFAPPRSYAELLAQAARIRAESGGARLDGLLWQGKQYEGLVVNVLEHLRAAGTDLVAADGTLFPDPGRAAEALAFMRGLVQRGVSPPWTTAADEELTRRAFGRGEAVFLRNWPYALDLLEAGDSPVRGRIGIAPLPGHPGGRAGAGSTGGAHLAIHRGSRHPDLALALVRALTSETAQRRMVTGAALYPTRVTLYHAPDLVLRHPALPAIAGLTLDGEPRPVTPYYLTISTLIQPELSAALVGTKTPAQAVSDARRAVAFVLRDSAPTAQRLTPDSAPATAHRRRESALATAHRRP